MLTAVLLSCTDREDLSETGVQQQLNLVLSIGHLGKTSRQSSDIIQDEGQAFRGLQSLLAIPVSTSHSSVTADDQPQVSVVAGSSANKVDDQHYYYMEHCSMARGTNRLLVYGQAATISGKESLAENGKLVTTLTGRMLLRDLTFSLQSIRDTYDVHPDAQALADYMTAIANTTGWSTTADASLKALYLDFINATSDGSGLMAGSAAHVKAYVKALKEQIEGNADELSAAIIDNINNTSLNACLDNGYPSASTSVGLPDGAAALRWTGNAFTVRTQTTTLDNINGIIRYTYPAELMYYVDSPIRTSDKEVGKSHYETAGWDYLLNHYYTAGHAVSGSTQSVAVEAPLQYGVCCMQMTLTPISGELRDSKNVVVDYGSASNFPLTAVIIGAQHTMGFDFKPMGEQSDGDTRFIYDPIEGNATTQHTMVLQSYDGEKVPVVLEFENNTGKRFAGKEGIIYPGTKFYLIAQIDPASLTEPENKPADYNDIKKRVFTQDHTTEMTMRVVSLANAYSCMPDLLSPRLELGVQIVAPWIQSTTTTVVM